MNKWLELLVGLVLLIVPVYIIVASDYIRSAVYVVLSGSIVLGVALIGLLFIMLGISDLKD